jgi:hypothetical protein
MIWLVWRQHRAEARIAGAALAVLAAFFLVTGLSIHATYQQLGVGDCLGAAAAPNCTDILDAFHQATGFWRGFTLWLTFMPMLLAMLVGAPLIAREFEQGTFRLVWTQSVPRLRWLAVKLALDIGACVALTIVETALVTWWRVPFAQMSSGLDPQQFDVEGLVPLAYVAYAVALAIAAGAFLRKAIPAMVASLVGFVFVRYPILFLARPYYQSPLSATWDPFLQTSVLHPQRGDWVFDGGWLTATGHQVDDAQVVGACATDSAHYNLQPGTPFTACTHAHGWLIQEIWQPADRFWLFQGIESAIFLALAAALVALTIWWVRRRIA